MANDALVLTDSWYWNRDQASRQWAQRYFAKMKKMPSSLQAADYSSVTTYLKAVQAAGSTDSDKVMAQLKKMKIDDFYAKVVATIPGEQAFTTKQETRCARWK